MLINDFGNIANSIPSLLPDFPVYFSSNLLLSFMDRLGGDIINESQSIKNLGSL
jgi:hypothetical protein